MKKILLVFGLIVLTIGYAKARCYDCCDCYGSFGPPPPPNMHIINRCPHHMRHHPMPKANISIGNIHYRNYYNVRHSGYNSNRRRFGASIHLAI